MEYSPQRRAELIIAACMEMSGTNPYEIFHAIAREDCVRIHGPEHHVLDGACILTAFRNAGGDIDLRTALQKLMHEGLRMPGAACGLWGVCGAVTSIGAALAIIDGTGPLSTEDWGSHMEYTSAALARLAKTGGPRCCKRDAFSAMEQAVDYIQKRYGVTLDMPPIQCVFSAQNARCIGTRCPYHVQQRLLFEIDTKDYDLNGVAFVRHSARCINIKNGLVAMVHSIKYDYYKFPGGGIEEDESTENAMIRETREEAGLVVIPESVKEYGYVHRIQKSDHDGQDYFVQDNYYYLCDVEETVYAQDLDDYEADEKFTLEYVEPDKAIFVNRNVDHGPKDQIMLEREARVLELLKEEGYFS